MKTIFTILLLSITLSSFSQEKDYPDLIEIFETAKKDSTELVIYTKPPRESCEHSAGYSFNPQAKTIGYVYEIKRDGVLILKRFYKKAKKGARVEYKKELHYVLFEDVSKVKYIFTNDEDE